MATNANDLFPPVPKPQELSVSGPLQQAVKAPASVNPDMASQQTPALFSANATPTPTPTPAAPAASPPAAPAASPSAAPLTSPSATTAAAEIPTIKTGATSGAGPFQQSDKEFKPFVSTVDPSTETVQGQLKNLFSEGNPLLVQARNRAAASAAGRGLQNSSLAAGAGELAQMNAALPIAQQDAATYSQRAMANAQTINEYQQIQMQYYQDLGKLKEQGNIQDYLTTLQAGYEKDLAVLNGNIQKDIHNQDNAAKLIELATQGDIEAKLQLQKYGFDSQLSAQENLAKLTQIAAQGDANAKLQLQQFNFDSLLKDKELGNNLTLEDKRIQGQQNAILLEYEQRGVLSSQEASQAMEQLNAQHQDTLDQIAMQLGLGNKYQQEQTDQQLALSNKYALEQIAAQAAATGGVADKDRSAQLQAQYLTAVAARQAAASAEITQIYTTPKLSAVQQNTGVANAYSRLQSDLAALSVYYKQSPLWPTSGTSKPASVSGATPPSAGGNLFPNSTPGATGASGPTINLPGSVKKKKAPQGSNFVKVPGADQGLVSIGDPMMDTLGYDPANLFGGGSTLLNPLDQLGLTSQKKQKVASEIDLSTGNISLGNGNTKMEGELSAYLLGTGPKPNVGKNSRYRELVKQIEAMQAQGWTPAGTGGANSVPEYGGTLTGP